MITGSASERSASPGSDQSSWGKPPAGSTRSERAKAEMSRRPIQKTGTAMPSCETAEIAMPYQRLDRYAAMKPTGSAITIASTKAMSVSGMVTSRRAAISGPTGSPLIYDVPRLSVASCPSQRANCSSNGWSSPTCRRAASICSGVAPIEMRAFAGSPGSRRSRKKSTMLASRSVTTRKARRRSRYVVIVSQR